MASAVVEERGCEAWRVVAEVAAVDEVAVGAEADDGRVRRRRRVVRSAVQALVRVAEHVAVDVGLARALADVAVAGRRLAGGLVPDAAVVLRDPVLHAVDRDADARAVGEAVGADARAVAIRVFDGRVARRAVEEVDVVRPRALGQVDDVERVLEAVVAVDGARRVARAVGHAVGHAERPTICVFSEAPSLLPATRAARRYPSGKLDAGGRRARHVVERRLEDAALAGREQDEPLVVAEGVLDRRPLDDLLEEGAVADAVRALRAVGVARACGVARRRAPRPETRPSAPLKVQSVTSS